MAVYVFPEEAVAEVKRQAMVELERLVVRNGAKTRDEEEETLASSQHNVSLYKITVPYLS